MVQAPSKPAIHLGLSSEEAHRRLIQHGHNEIVPSRLESLLGEAKKILLEPMGLMLLVLSVLYAVLGNRVDSLILLGAYFPVVGVDVLLEIRAHKALKALRAHLVVTSKVLRDGRVQEIQSREIVVGDVIVFEEGQSLPADGKILEAEALRINEAALTGESIPVDKSVGEDFLGGTIPLQGRGLGLVERTGRLTEIGKITGLVEQVTDSKTPLQRKVSALIRQGVVGAVVLAIFLFFIEWWRGETWIQAFIVALTFGMATVPEEFPVVFTLYLSLGAWRLSRHGVLVKSLPSVEALGSVDVICTDKTGTLTEGKFQLESLEAACNCEAELLWKVALMACETTVVDSMEAAIVEKGKPYFSLLNEWRLKWDYPFENTGKHMSHVWESSDGQFLIAMKGAVEGVLEHCKISSEDTERLEQRVHQLAAQGKRLLGLAYRSGPCRGERIADERELTFLGLLIFSDPVRTSVREAVGECQSAGIEIKMLTGDHPVTAHAVADEIGMDHDHQLLFTGDQLRRMDPQQRSLAFQQGAIFSRVMPDQKHEMVQALQASGKVVAMTGDGINDAPALKLADIGISMGLNATEVARSTAQMVLIKNDFKGIVEAVFEGRRIFSNLQKSFSYLIAFHIPVIVLAFVPPLLGWGHLLLPIHIVLLELIVHPISAFGFENLPITNKMRLKGLLTWRRVFESVLAGVLLCIACLIVYRVVMAQESVDKARTLALATALFGMLFFVFDEAWPIVNRRLLLIGITLVGLIVALCQLPILENLFHVVELGKQEFALSAALGFGAALPTWILRWKVASPPGFEPGFQP